MKSGRPAARAGASPAVKPRLGGTSGTAKAGQRLNEILDASADVFAAKGYHSASTQDIADILNIRQASLYYYLPSKEAALEAVCARGAEGFYEEALRIAAQTGTAQDKIRALVKAHLTPLLDRRNYVTVFLHERRHLPRDSRMRISQWMRAYEKVVEEVIRTGMKAGEFRRDIKPRLRSLGVLGMLRTVSDWYGKEPNASLDDTIAEFSDLLLSGMKV
jgi:AcrR family transcriptional regulator